MRGNDQRIESRKRYIEEVTSKKAFSLPSALSVLESPDFDSARTGWPASWLGLEVRFELLTPWYSKDDRVFHVMDNPVRKDRVFGVPYMAASSWKGLLRWACRMQAGLREYLRENDGKIEGWRDPDWILHLFGNEKGEEEDFHRGALVFYPTWFDKIGFEVINPHSRERRAGTQPVYYEVVPIGANGTLPLLYAPWPGMKPEAKPGEIIPKLLEAIEKLLTTYGISAKRTVGWGTAKITEWKAYRKGQAPVQASTREELWKDIVNWFKEGTP
jgi:CRISPR-associated protein Cmr2